MPCYEGLSLLCIMIVPANQKLVVMAIAIIGKFFITMSFGIIFFYSNELFPTVVRATGMGTSEMICRDYS